MNNQFTIRDIPPEIIGQGGTPPPIPPMPSVQVPQTPKTAPQPEIIPEPTKAPNTELEALGEFFKRKIDESHKENLKKTVAEITQKFQIENQNNLRTKEEELNYFKNAVSQKEAELKELQDKVKEALYE